VDEYPFCFKEKEKGILTFMQGTSWTNLPRYYFASL